MSVKAITFFFSMSKVTPVSKVTPIYGTLILYGYSKYVAIDPEVCRR